MVKRFLKCMRSMHKDEKGITGLETAIILIAFVVVAAVFAFTALSAGLFSTEKSKEAVYSGVKTAQSTMELKGNVVALDSNANGAINTVTFTLSLAAGGQPMDFTDTAGGLNKVIINVLNSNLKADDIGWTVSAVGKDDNDNMLDQGEQFLVTTTNLEGTAIGTTLRADSTFTIQVVPPVGATLVIEKTLPGVIDAVNNLN